MELKGFVPGTRVLKTLIAIILSIVISKIFSLDTSSMTVIALFSINRTFPDTKKTAKERFVGVIISSIFTYFTLLIISKGWEIQLESFLYYFLSIIFLFILMQLLIGLKLKGSFIYAIIVYLGIIFSNGKYSPSIAVLREAVQSIITLTICLKIDSCKYLNYIGKKLENIKK